MLGVFRCPRDCGVAELGKCGCNNVGWAVEFRVECAGLLNGAKIAVVCEVLHCFVDVAELGCYLEVVACGDRTEVLEVLECVLTEL